MDWIEQLKSGDRRRQSQVALFARGYEESYAILPLMIEKAREVDVDSGLIDVTSSGFVGETLKTSAKLIRDRGYSDENAFHRGVLDWILQLNYCSELNVAAYSVYALGELWIPPDSVRDRLMELVHIERRADNDHPNTIRGIAFRVLARRDPKRAKKLVDTPARFDFEDYINDRIDKLQKENSDNEKTPLELKAELAWLNEPNSG